MIKNKDIPFLLYFCFIVSYLIMGDNEAQAWNGMFFCANYFVVFFLFRLHKNRIIRFLGMDLAISLFLFSILKFFTNFEIEKEYSFIPFFVILIGFLCLNKWRK